MEELKAGGELIRHSGAIRNLQVVYWQGNGAEFVYSVFPTSKSGQIIKNMTRFALGVKKIGQILIPHLPYNFCEKCNVANAHSLLNDVTHDLNRTERLIRTISDKALLLLFF